MNDDQTIRLPDEKRAGPTRTASDALLENINAMIEATETGASAAVERLTNRDDPQSILTRLSLLIEEKRTADAVNLARSHTPDPKWLAEAALAFATEGDEAQARQLLGIAVEMEDEDLTRSCRVAIARGLYVRALASKFGTRVRPGTLTSQEEAGVRAALAALEPILVSVRDHGIIRSGIESTAHVLASDIFCILDNLARAKEVSLALLTRIPIPIHVTTAIRRGLLPASEEILSRLRSERADDFSALIEAAMLEGHGLSRPTQALASMRALANQATTTEHKEQLVDAIASLLELLSAEEVPAAIELVRNTAPPSSLIPALLEIEELLQEERFNDALVRLESIHPIREMESVIYMQVRIQALWQSGERGRAVDVAAQEADKVGSPEVLEQWSRMAITAGKTQEAKSILRQLITSNPDSKRGHYELAQLLNKTGDFRAASEQFRALAILDPSVPQHRLNEAATLIRVPDLEGSLKVFEELCIGVGGVEAFAGRAHVLRMLNRANEGWEVLNSVKDRYWGDAGFVVTYMQFAYASQRDVLATDAMQQLKALKQQGTVKDNIFWETSLDGVVGEVRRSNDQQKQLYGQYIGNAMSWLAIERHVNRPSYLAWRMRTQPLTLSLDDPIYRASLCIYSTNGVAPMAPGREAGVQPAIECVEPTQPVAVDLSALMTLHRLGLLREAADYFGRLVYPANYHEDATRERGQLIFHQPSRRTAYRAIRLALDGGQIKSVPVDTAKKLATIDEYESNLEASCSSVGLADLLPLLEPTGALSDLHLKMLESIIHRPASPSQQLNLGQEIVFSLDTLETLAQLEVLSVVLPVTRPRLTDVDVTNLNAALHAWDMNDEVRQWHDSLWATIAADARFVPTAVTLPQQLEEQTQISGRPGKRFFGFEAALIAIQSSIPLLADDRATQVLVQVERRDCVNPGFGVDCLIIRLAETKRLSWELAADGLLNMIDWRYRFIVPPPEALVALATRHLRNPPGNPLRRVAAYAHDCFRDAGLGNIVIVPDQQFTVAHHLFLSWATLASQFCVDVWEDERFGKEQRTALIRWAMAELLPSPPAFLPHNVAAGLPPLLPRLVIAKAILRSVGHQNANGANEVLRVIADALELSTDAYIKIVSEVLRVA